MTVRVEVALGERSYPLYIGAGLLKNASLLRSALAGQQVMVVSNPTVAALYRETVLASLTGLQVDSVLLPDGEAYKTLETLNSVFDALLRHRHNRRTTLLALGGGVTGDMTGFAAACYQRGVAFVQLPTTLLAQVDSSVGGKTAVNHPLGKNMIGAFHQPRAVLIDTDTLKTLPRRELIAGIAEIIKYGIIDDEAFFSWLEQNLDALLACDSAALTTAIERSCAIKARIVAADEREQGERAHLNLGHSFGHAIETGLGHGVWLHGEAVACGMVLAAELSAALGSLAARDVARIEVLLQRAGLPCRLPRGVSPEQLLELMRVDKKNRGSALRLILPTAIGRVCISEAASDAAVLQILRARAQH